MRKTYPAILFCCHVAVRRATQPTGLWLQATIAGGCRFLPEDRERAAGRSAVPKIELKNDVGAFFKGQSFSASRKMRQIRDEIISEPPVASDEYLRFGA